VAAGIINDLGAQLSIKKPMEAAVDGSAGMVSAPAITGRITGEIMFGFLHDTNKIMLQYKIYFRN